METKGTLMAATYLVALSLWSASAFPAHEVREARMLYPDGQASNSLGSYQYSYETREHGTKSETSDKDGNVEGTFSYMDVDGSIRSVRYKAGANIGFVIVSDKVDYSPQAKKQQAESHLHCSAVPQEALLPAEPAGPISGPLSSGGSSYSFSFDALDHSRMETSDPSGNIQGTYTYNDGEGHTRRVEYTAGKDMGFVVTGTKVVTMVTKPPSSKSQTTSSDSSNRVSQFESGVGSGEIQGYRLPISPYSFDYDAGTHSHSQQADTQGQVKGEYSYMTADGFKRTITYSAGEKTGFIITGDLIEPVATSGGKQTPTDRVHGDHGNKYPGGKKTEPSGHSSSKGQPSSGFDLNAAEPERGYSFGYDAGTHSHSESRDESGFTKGEYSYLVPDGTVVTIKYMVGGDSGFVITDEISKPASADDMAALRKESEGHKGNANQPGRLTGQQSSASNHPSTPYSFDYQTPTHSHTESKNELGDVQGSYSYLTADGAYVTISYKAGNEMGFVITSQRQEPASGELLRILETETQRKVEHDSNTPHSDKAVLSPSGYHPDSTSHVTPKPVYKFEYNVDTHSHKEESDGTGNVVGQYSTLSADGQIRTTKYSSSPSTGYTVLNQESHPASPNLLAKLKTESHNKHSGQQYTQQGNAQLDATSGHLPLSKEVPIYVENQKPQHHNHVGAPLVTYSFQYDAASHSREEKLNSEGKVEGSYSYLTAEGKLRTVKYLAGGKDGFVITGEKVEQAPKELLALLMNNNGDSHQTKLQSSGTQSDTQLTSKSYASSSAPFIINYDAGSHSRKEKIDSTGIVSGEYTILTPDHKLRTIQYQASGSKGFVITKETLEEAPIYLPSQVDQGGYLSGISQSFADRAIQSQTPSPFSYSYDAGSHSHQFSSGYQNQAKPSYHNEIGKVSSVDQGNSSPGTRQVYSRPVNPISKKNAEATTAVEVSPDILYDKHVLKTIHQPSANKYGYRLHLV